MEDSTLETIDLVILLLVYGLPVLLAVGGLVIGSFLERKHFESIREREKRLAGLPALPTKVLDSSRETEEGELVTASVVVSLDYFKRILASLRNIFGGRVRAYESLLDRAKREAILRLKEQAPDSDAIINIRLETSSLAYTQSRKKGIGGVEVLAYGTAVRYR
ncbi:MAG: YbjQ family protein [Verrucomicrobiota bacterium]